MTAVPFAYESLTKGVTLKDLNMKLIVTDYGLAHWQAGNNGYNINDLNIKMEEVDAEF